MTQTGCTRRAALAAIGALALPGIARAVPDVAENDDRLDPAYIEAELAPGRVIQGYSVRQKAGDARLPGVVVIHGEKGLTGHAREVARALALEGFVAFAPDMLSPGGGTPGDPVTARAAMAAIDLAAAVDDATALVRWMGRERRTTGAVAILGFGWGGAVAERVAVTAGDALRAGVGYYGLAPGAAEASRVAAPLLIHLPGAEPRLAHRSEAWVRALQRAGKTVNAYFYPGAVSGFAGDGGDARRDPVATRLAWERTIGFLQQHLA